MKLPPALTPTVYLAGDIGTSASKFFYRVSPGQTVPLWMAAEVAEGLTSAALPALNTGGRPQDSAWLQIGDEVVLVGDAAKTVLETNSFAANKSQKAAYKILAALGVVAEQERLPQRYEATIWLPLPLTEIRTRDEIASQLMTTASQGFSFRGRSQQVKLSLKFFPEGFGLYLNRKKQLEAIGRAVEQQRTLIVMMGHRNLSVLCFEGGSLKLAESNSGGVGFWTVFEKSARSLGITPADYPALLSALTTGKTQQISQARGNLYEFGAIATAVQQSYWQAVSVTLQDNLLGQLADGSAEVVISGGGSVMVREAIADYFDHLGLSNRLTIADGLQEHLPQIVAQLPEAGTNPTIALRMADCYGLFQGLIGKLSKTAV